MKYFFVDYENTKDGGISGIETLDPKDHVFLFYSKNADRISIDTMKSVIASKAQLHLKKVEKLGKNALDFQLCTIIGGILAKFSGKKLDISVISQDTGFNAITTTSKEVPCIPECKGIVNIFRSNSIALAEKKIQGEKS